MLVLASMLLLQAAAPAAAKTPGSEEGRAVLDCGLRGGRLTECRVVSVEPAGRGFEEAALRMVPMLRIDPRAKRGGRVRVPIVFQVEAEAPAAGSDASASSSAPAATGEVVTRPVWLKGPRTDGLRRFYPERARQREVEGRSVLLCDTRAGGWLSQCRIQLEEPAGYGFGAATLRLFEGARIGPEDRDGRPTAGRPVEVRMTWKIGG